MPQERRDRHLIAYSDNQAVFIPGEMEDNSNPDNQTIHVGNVWTGLQWYQAYNNDTGPLTREQKRHLLLEIFKEPNDLVGLARTVELQTGVSGLIESVLESYSWAEWRIGPHFPDVTERMLFEPQIDVGVRVGDNLVAISEFTFGTEVGEDVEPDQQVKNAKITHHSNFIIIRDGKEIGDGDEHNIMEMFSLRSVEVLPGKKIRLEGDDLGEDEEMAKEPERLFYSYILTSREEIEFETRTGSNRIDVIRKRVEESEKPVVLSRQELKDMGWDSFDWKGIRDKIGEDQMAKKALVYFLLPYCDMPTTDGHYYVLPEEMVND